MGQAANVSRNSFLSKREGHYLSAGFCQGKQNDIEDLHLRRACGEESAPAAGTLTGDALLNALTSDAAAKPLYKSSEIQNVHLELTTQCNAACPQCARNEQGGRVNPLLADAHAELSLRDVKHILPPSFLKQLKKVYICGNFGDPGVARDCFEVLKYLRGTSKGLKVGLFTNGGMRTPEWWSSLGKLMQPPERAFVRFAIDGDQHTNHLYRQHVVWDRLMANVRAYISAGGNAEWDFIVFEHNEHQIDAMRSLAESLGFSKFTAKKTGRFLNKSTGTIQEAPVKDVAGQVVRHVRPTTIKEWQNEAAVDGVQRAISKYGSMDAYYDRCEVSCKVAKEKEVYISAEGLVLPCCWLAGELFRKSDRQLERLLLAADTLKGRQTQSALGRRGLAAVVDQPAGLFDRLVKASLRRPSVAEGRLRTCASVCGQEVPAFRSQFLGASTELTPSPIPATGHAAAGETGSGMSSPSSDAGAEKAKVLIWYGSETGNAERLARLAGTILGGVAEVCGVPQSPSIGLLAGRAALLLVLATWGDGEPSNDALAFFNWLERCGKQHGDIPTVAVYGVGSSLWPQFNAAARRASQLLSTAGFPCLADKGEGDAAKPDLDEQFLCWLNQMLMPSLEACGVSALAGIPCTIHPVLRDDHAVPMTLVRRSRLAPGDNSAVYCEIELEGPLSYGIADAIGVLPPAENNLLSRPRWFTASSSPSSSKALRLTVRQVPGGVCSPWLCNLDVGSQINCLPPRQSSPLAAALSRRPSAKVLLVAAGAGIAPFMAFLQQRAVEKPADGLRMPWVLFAGCRQAGDGLPYAERLESYVRQGVLQDLYVAESRPVLCGTSSRYVQQVLLERKAQLTELLQPGQSEGGVLVLVCGSAAMGSAVRSVVDLIASESNSSVADLEREGRYVAELW